MWLLSGQLIGRNLRRGSCLEDYLRVARVEGLEDLMSFFEVVAEEMPDQFCQFLLYFSLIIDRYPAWCCGSLYVCLKVLIVLFLMVCIAT